MTREEVIEIACGNEMAARFLLSFLAFVHLIDDLYDKDVEVDDKRLIRENIWWMEEMVMNEWVQEHKGLLWPLIVVATNAWLDANEWEKDNSLHKRIAADVIKSTYQEVVFFVAYLCGGREHMRKMSAKHREYNFERKEAT